MAAGQGAFVFGNRYPPDVNARFILPTDPPDGQSSSVGTDFTVTLLGGPAGSPLSNLVPLEPSTTTFQGAAGSSGAGYVRAVFPRVPGVEYGSVADILVRVTSPTEACLFEGVFRPPPLVNGGASPGLLDLGTSPLVLTCVPEPPEPALLLAGLTAVLAALTSSGRRDPRKPYPTNELNQ
jgi:hypothetical protein